MNPVLNTAVKAARRAGDMMLRAANNLPAVKIDSKAFNDFVSDIDRTAEEIIREILQEAYPQHKITAEEGGSSGPEKAEYEWIIDPLDGTTNYLHGHPQYAISMALLHKGVLQEALVYAPERNDLYLASRGEGALLNDRRIRVSSRIELNRCLIGTGFPVFPTTGLVLKLAASAAMWPARCRLSPPASSRKPATRPTSRATS